MAAYNRRLWDLWDACGVEEAWDAWNRVESALAEIEEGIIALPVTDFGLAARQVQILRDWGCAEDDRPLMAFFERIERAAGPPSAPAFATREAT